MRNRKEADIDEEKVKISETISVTFGDLDFIVEAFKPAGINTPIEQLSFDRFTMVYDFGLEQEFTVKKTGSFKYKPNTANTYPIVVDGKGKGAENSKEETRTIVDIALRRRQNSGWCLHITWTKHMPPINSVCSAGF